MIDEIIKAEAVEPDQADVDAMLEEYAKAMGKTLEAVKAEFTETQIDYFTHRSEINKVLDMLWDSAKVTDETAAAEVEAEAEAKPAKKAAAKKPAKKAAETVDEDGKAEKPAAKKPAVKAKAEKAKTTAKSKAIAEDTVPSAE